MQDAHRLLAGLPADRLVVLCGDANGCPGGDPVPGVVGTFGQGPLTEGGEELIEFAAERGFHVANWPFLKPMSFVEGVAETFHRAREAAGHARGAQKLSIMRPVYVAATEAEARAILTRGNPQGRLIQPEEVAATVGWLCLPSSGAVTGQAIAVAGGEVM